MSYILFKTDPI